MAENPSQLLSPLISAAAVLSGSEHRTAQFPDLATVLKTRLVRTYDILQQDEYGNVSDVNLEVLQFFTAKESLHLVERIQNLLDSNDSGYGSQSLLLGTRDLSYVRTLLSIVFKWGVAPFITELEFTRLSCHPPKPGEPRIIDLTERQLRFEDLPVITLRLLKLLFGSTKIPQTWISTSILSQHAVDLLTPCLIVGWAPKPVYNSFDRHAKDVRELSIRFINVLRPHEAIGALGTILSSVATTLRSFPYLSRACGHLLSNQLRRPDGVRGLCTAVFGEDLENEDLAPLDKLEHIAKVLCTVPSSTNPQDYYRSIVPPILELLIPSASQQSPSSHKRAAAFTLSRMLSTSFQHHVITSGILLPLLHLPLISPSPTDAPASPITQSASHLSSLESLQTLQTFLLHADPSPIELSTMLTPVVPEIYALVALYRSSKTADPNVRESLGALLNTWGRIVSASDAIDGLWRVVTGSGGNWELGLDGLIRSTRPVLPPSISLLTAAELEASSLDGVDINANPFNLRPDPPGFVAFLTTLDRKDVSSEIFVRLLNQYRKLSNSDEQPTRTLLFLQLILQMQAQLSSTVLSKPEHVLSFIKHALGSETHPSTRLLDKPALKKGLGLGDLRIVEENPTQVNDSDEEEESDDSRGGKDGMLVTSITLLLSILEASVDLSPHNTPDLNDILGYLDRLTSHASPVIRQLAREARLVLTARTASTSAAASSSVSTSTTAIESPHATYQKALKLLQDPIIPVRAHGLQLLRDLVSRPSAKQPRPAQAYRDESWLAPALLPGILSIFIQSIQDDESYIFLNAVQGLAAMVDGYGREVLRGIIEVYLSGTGVGCSGVTSCGEAMLRQELDVRIRVGEALNAVVKRCGEALGSYVNTLIPPLLTIFRSSHLPTTLRVSALSILAQCVATNAVALTAYTVSLADSCLELIQLESVAVRSIPTKFKGEYSSKQGGATDEGKLDEGQNDLKQPTRHADIIDSDPMTKNAKAAPLRRTALHFFSQLLRSQITNMYDSRSASTTIPNVTLNVGESQIKGLPTEDEALPASLLKRAGVVFGYVATTDEDGVARVMAREALELVKQYKEAALSF